ncbi:hypothetical protein HRG_010025 [Hirsutella rhossiliensis]|uniref:Uncharacterized protein n=1 Tax=Hirsutella rhossiliensis TaxID=111463 RepID=A0A9P8MPR1_9HYPO|nr:uncharacterized protein HRG_10025 [Hirsutella rhossiliensis]KAH0958980.1 hypothetical protein HRG_10025 [Hirsutella rhossiliensis]
MDYFSCGTNDLRGDSQAADRPLGQLALDPQASWFDFSGLHSQNDVLFPDNRNLSVYDSPFQYGKSTNDDTKWLLNNISSRLDALELAVSTGNMRVGYVQDGISEVLKRSQTAEDMMRELHSLKTSLKELMKSFVLLSLGGEGVEDIDMQSSRAG